MRGAGPTGVGGSVLGVGVGLGEGREVDLEKTAWEEGTHPREWSV